MRIIFFIFTLCMAYGQTSNRFTITPPQANTDTGILAWKELNGTGNHEVQISAPNALAATWRGRWPITGGTAGQCLQTDGAGQWVWGSCSGTSETYAVTAYGAVCDATTDDTAAIQAAIDAAEGAGGGTIVLPFGTCNFTSLTVTNNYVSFKGQGRNVSALQSTSSGDGIVIDTSAAPIYFFEMRDMMMLGNSGGSSTAIKVTGHDDFLRSTINNVYFASHAKTVHIANAYYWHPTTTGTVTIDVSNGFAQQINATDNITIANPTGTIAPGDKLYINFRQDATGGRTISWGSEFTGFSNPSFTANLYTRYVFTRNGSSQWVQATSVPGLVLSTGFYDWFSFTNNFIDNSLVSGGSGLWFAGGLTSPGGVIANNQFIQGSGGTAIYYTNDFGDIVISGNHSELGAYFLNADCDAASAVPCAYGERLAVTGNKVDNTPQPIRIDGVRNSRITGNVVLGGVANPVEVVGVSSGLEIDEDYNQGKRYIGANGSTQVSPAKILLGDHTIDAANTDVGLSVVDTGSSAFVSVGQSLARSAGLGWSYDATASNAYGLLYTFGASNSMKYIAAFHKFTGDIYPEANDTYALGGASDRWASMAATDVNFGGGVGTITLLPAGTAPTIGDCWLASSTGGDGNWGACTGGGWTVSGSDVYRSAGSVGIGVTSPASALHMSATNVAIFMDGYSSVAPNILMRQSNGSAGSETATVSGDRIGQVAMAGYGTARVTAARIGAYAGSNFTGSSAESYIRFDTTANGSTTVTERWRITGSGQLLGSGSGSSLSVGGDFAIAGQVVSALTPSADNTYPLGTAVNRWSEVRALDGVFGDDVSVGDALTVTGNAVLSGTSNTMSGNLVPGFDGLGSIGTVSLRYGAVFGYTGNFAGAVTMSGSTITASSTFSSDLIPTTSNVYVNGSSTSYWNQIAGATLFVEGNSVRPRTGGSGTVGISTARFSKGWLQDIDFTGTMTAPSGNTGAAATLTCGAGQAIKNITVSGGIVTSVSCGTP